MCSLCIVFCHFIDTLSFYDFCSLVATKHEIVAGGKSLQNFTGLTNQTDEGNLKRYPRALMLNGSLTPWGLVKHVYILYKIYRIIVYLYMNSFGTFGASQIANYYLQKMKATSTCHELLGKKN